jgi:hypothetical protein
VADAVHRLIRRGIHTAALMAVAVLAAACEQGAARYRWQRGGEPLMRDVVRMGRLGDKKLDEASGAIASIAEPGVLWSQNDSGNDEYLFAYDSTGHALGRVLVKGTKNRDWEALASGPCPEGQCVTVGDIGDNGARRDDLILHQLVEPLHTSVSVSASRSLSLRYADGPHDVEAMYAGADGSLWLVTKRPERDAAGRYRPVRVYHVPRSAWEQREYVAPVVDSLPITPEKGASHDWVTDASLSPLLPDGRRLLVLLSYGAVHIFETDPATGKPGAAVARCALPIRENTAEGVSWLPDGRILLVTEGTMGAIYAGRCP